MNAKVLGSIAIAVALTACGGTSTGPGPSDTGSTNEAGSDAVVVDTGNDTGNDTGGAVEVATDTGSGADTATDAGADVVIEAASDTAIEETSSDAGSDVIDETALDSGIDAIDETAGDAAVDVVEETTSDAIAETSSDAEIDVVSDVAPDVAPDAVIDVASDTTTSDMRPSDTATDVASDTTTTDTHPSDTATDVAADVTADVVDAPAPLAWGSACTVGRACAAPTGEVGLCTDAYPTPTCVHTCNKDLAYSLCESGAGMCVPITTRAGVAEGNVCVKKCGDVDHATCGAGAACTVFGYRAATLSDGGTEYNPVGACTPDCGSTSCAHTTTSCDPARLTCEPKGCTGANACPTGSTCVAGGSYCESSSPTALFGACTGSTTTANGCTSNLCLAAPGAAGYCTSLCDTANPTACGDGVCWTGLSIAYGDNPDSGTIAYPLSSFTREGVTAGTCVAKCVESSDCPSGFYCGETDGRRGCIPVPLPEATTAPSTGLAGDVCHANGDCASNICANAPGFADGVCLAVAPPCPGGTQQNGTTNECDKTCSLTADEACPGSLNCVMTATAGVNICGLVVCRANSDCAAGYVCDPATAACVTTPTTTAKNTGGACTTNTMCSGGQCIAETTAPSAWPGGYCSSYCTLLPDRSDTCAAGDVCSASTIGGIGFCFKLCDTTAPYSKYGTCRAGYKCAPLSDPSVGYCVTD
ncbi:MAG: hypothetical protein ACHREM_17255 [Polyangiales bacterium]